MRATAAVVLLLLVITQSSAQSIVDLSSTYQFNASLHERYTLYWSFNNDAQTIRFAVRVRTTGWVGFGISPNGQMPQSDVVIGWVDNGRSYFDVNSICNNFVIARARAAQCYIRPRQVVSRFLVTARTKSVKSEVWPLFVLRMRSQFLRPFSRISNENLRIMPICFCACSLGYWTLRRSCKRERQAEVLARGLATYVYATCNRKSRAITCPALPLVALVCKIFAKSCTVCRAGETDAEHVLIGCSSVPAY